MFEGAIETYNKLHWRLRCLLSKQFHLFFLASAESAAGLRLVVASFSVFLPRALAPVKVLINTRGRVGEDLSELKERLEARRDGHLALRRCYKFKFKFFHMISKSYGELIII
jgi:hypothetical protein